MVKQKIIAKLFCLYLICLLLPTIVFSDEVSIVNIMPDKVELEMGKYLSVRIVYIGKHVPESSHLEKWYDDFFVDRREIETENLAGELIQTTEYLRLYPRAIGNKVLHSIAQGGAMARPVKIKVVAAIRNNIDATPHWQALAETIWQGETIKVSIIQNLLHVSNQIVVEDTLFPGFFTEPLKQQAISQKSQKKVQLNWLITAQSPGVFQLDPPAIVQRGRGRWRFYLPRIEVKVKPLPSYIPATIPIGKLAIKSGLSYQQKQAFWFVEINNEGQLPEEIYSIRAQLSKVTGQPVEYVTLAASRIAHEGAFRSVHRYQVPVPEWSWGNNDLEISVAYFDVVDGQIHSISKKLPGAWNIPQFWRYLLWIILAFGSVIVLLLLLKVVRSFAAWRSFQNRLKKSHTPDELRQLLLGQGSFSTLEEWSKAKSLHSKTFIINERIAGQLNRLCYARQVQPENKQKNEQRPKSIEVSMAEIKDLLTKLYNIKSWLLFSRQS